MKASIIESIAEACHEINRIYCEGIGDLSQPSWGNAPVWQKDSAIAGVKLHLEHPETTPSQSHESWMAIKVMDGWVYGEVKDPEAKTHPCMLPYHELPVDQRIKDSLFGHTVQMMGRAFNAS